MLICWELQIPKVVFEGDYLQVTAIAKCDSAIETKLYSIMHDIHFLMNLVPNWKVMFTYQDANNIAHLLEKFAYNLGKDRIQIEDFPFVICDVRQEEKLCVADSYEC